MGCHAVTKSKVTSNAFEHRVNGLFADWLILIHSVIGLAAEHIVAEVNTGRVFKIQSHSFHNCCVNGDVDDAMEVEAESEKITEELAAENADGAMQDAAAEDVEPDTENGKAE